MSEQRIVAERDNGGSLVHKGLDVTVVDLFGTHDHVIEFRYIVAFPPDVALSYSCIPYLNA